MDPHYIEQLIRAVDAWVAAQLTPAFFSTVATTLIGTLVGAGVAFGYAIRRDDRNMRQQRKAAANVAALTLTQLANDFLNAKTYIVESQKFIDQAQPHSPPWMLIKAMHFTYSGAKFDLPSLIFLTEYKGGAEILEKLVAVQWKVHNFFDQLTDHAAANYELQQKLSASGLDHEEGASLQEINKAAGFALIARVESLVFGINEHLARTEPSIRDTAVGLEALTKRVFGDKHMIKLELPTHDQLVALLNIRFPEPRSSEP